jgi:hypothetical protein
MDIVVGGKTISHQDILGTTVSKKMHGKFLSFHGKQKSKRRVEHRQQFTLHQFIAEILLFQK